MTETPVPIWAIQLRTAETLRFANGFLPLDAANFTLGSEPTFLPDNRQDARLGDRFAEALQQTILGFPWAKFNTHDHSPPLMTLYDLCAIQTLIIAALRRGRQTAPAFLPKTGPQEACPCIACTRVAEGSPNSPTRIAGLTDAQPDPLSFGIYPQNLDRHLVAGTYGLERLRNRDVRQLADMDQPLYP